MEIKISYDISFPPSLNPASQRRVPVTKVKLCQMELKSW